MMYLRYAMSPFVFLWNAMFGVLPPTIDIRRLLPVPVDQALKGERIPAGALLVTRARLYRAPVKRVRREGYPDHIYSEKKLHVLGVIGMREKEPGEKVESRSFEIINRAREIVPGVIANPKDVLELKTTIEEGAI